jgi:uncharacterized protein (DUF302 family)
MKYYFNKNINVSFDETIEKVTAALKTKGFGVVSEIRMHEKFKEKLGVDFKRYTILGACNPSYAYKAIQAEEFVGTMLPCNIVISEKQDGTTDVVAINPVASMMAIENKLLEPLAQEVTDTLQNIIREL